MVAEALVALFLLTATPQPTRDLTPDEVRLLEVADALDAAQAKLSACEADLEITLLANQSHIDNLKRLRAANRWKRFRRVGEVTAAALVGYSIGDVSN